MPEVVAVTTFFQGKNDEWYWHTRALNGEVVSDGAEGYHNQKDAIAGYFAAQGIQWDKTNESWPTGYSSVATTGPNQFSISKYL